MSEGYPYPPVQYIWDGAQYVQAGKDDKDKPEPNEPSPGPKPPERTQCGNCGYINGGGTCPRCGKPM